MDIIVNDASALIDIYKAGLLESYSRLECRLLLPDVVEDELKSLQHLNFRDLGFEVVEIDGDGVLQVKALRDAHQQLSVADTFALVVAEMTPGSILLTGDGGLRRVAVSRGIEVHGLLWLIDELHSTALVSAAAIVEALSALQADRMVRLPSQLMTSYLERYQALADRGG